MGVYRVLPAQLPFTARGEACYCAEVKRTIFTLGYMVAGLVSY